MKRVFLMVLGLLWVPQSGQLWACDKCVKQCKATVKSCDDFIKECATCLKATSKLAKECENCKSSCKALTKRCKVAIVFCNWCKATNFSYMAIMDGVARDECITYCKKCVNKNQKLITYCKNTLSSLKDCKNTKLLRKKAVHQAIFEACKQCMDEGAACNKACTKCAEKLKSCKDKS